MQAVILAAGLGSRLGSLTSQKPKAMVEYQKEAIISYQINNLLKLGIKKIIIICGYKSHILIDFLKKKFDISNFIFVINNRFDETNSAFSFSLAKSRITSNSNIHINCDILFSVELLSNLISSNYDNCICVRKDLELKDKMENVTINENKQIIKMSLINDENSFYKAYGLAKISRQALNLNLDLYDSMQKELREKENYYGLIRNNLKNTNYYCIEAKKNDLAEINTQNDLNVCVFQQGNNINS